MAANLTTHLPQRIIIQRFDLKGNVTFTALKANASSSTGLKARKNKAQGKRSAALGFETKMLHRPVGAKEAQ